MKPWVKSWRESQCSPRFRALPYRARCLFRDLITLVNDEGRFFVGDRSPAVAIAMFRGAERADRQYIRRSLDYLLKDGCVSVDDVSRELVIPRFEDWQKAGRKAPKTSRQPVDNPSITCRQPVDNPSISVSNPPKSFKGHKRDTDTDTDTESTPPYPPSPEEAQANRDAGKRARSESLREWTPQALFEALTSAWATHHGIAFGITPSPMDIERLGNLLDARTMTRDEMLAQVAAFARVQRVYADDPGAAPAKFNALRHHVAVFARCVPQWPARLREVA